MSYTIKAQTLGIDEGPVNYIWSLNDKLAFLYAAKRAGPKAHKPIAEKMPRG